MSQGGLGFKSIFIKKSARFANAVGYSLLSTALLAAVYVLAMAWSALPWLLVWSIVDWDSIWAYELSCVATTLLGKVETSPLDSSTPSLYQLKPM